MKRIFRKQIDGCVPRIALIELHTDTCFRRNPGLFALGQGTILRSSARHIQGARTNHKAVVMEFKMAANRVNNVSRLRVIISSNLA